MLDITALRPVRILLSNARSVLFHLPRHDRAKQPAYKRIVLKLSGEACAKRGARENISPQIVREIAERDQRSA